MDPLDILKKHFGYTGFRLHQETIIQSVLANKDTFVLMPTGAGKSICYQIPALMFDGLTVVVSPLIALMKDQVDSLRLNGIPAAYLNAAQSRGEQEKILQNVRLKQVKLLYLAPEKLLGNGMAFLHTLESFGISLLAIDEAHCISHWGHDFRPEYGMLANVKRIFPKVPVIALTATADRLTQKDIAEKLALKDPAVFISSFNRPNIRYTVAKKQSNSFRSLLSFLEKHRDHSGIIYCLSRKSTEALAADLELHGFKALPYHAGMDREQRSRNQDMFLRDDVRIIVATIAFGMGIDKSNVRYVVHMDLPKNIESYYQETGRAGRDGIESEALLFYSPGDVMKLKKFVLIEKNSEQTGIQLKKLDEMARYAELRTCRRKYLLNYFDESTIEHCGNCDVCLREKEFSGSVPLRFIDIGGTLVAANVHPSRPRKHAEHRSDYESMLFQDLRKVRRDLAILEDVPAYLVLSDSTLIELATYLPYDLNDLARISGFGEAKLARYGKIFLEAVKAYCQRRGLATRMDQKRVLKTHGGKIEHDTHTRQQSLILFRRGQSVEQIAIARNLSPGTIESHLAFYVGLGQLAVDELVDAERIAVIRHAIESVGGKSLTPIRNFLGEEYSYSEIRYVLADPESSRVEEPGATDWLHVDTCLLRYA